MPASSSSSTSCQRLGWREPGTLECASSSTRISAGLRASAASRSNSLERACRGSSTSLQRQQLEALRAGPAVSARPWVSTMPTTTSTPCGLLRARRRQHRVGLADAGRRAEVDPQLAALRLRLLLAAVGASSCVGDRGAGRSSAAASSCDRPAASSAADRHSRQSWSIAAAVSRAAGLRGQRPRSVVQRQRLSCEARSRRRAAPRAAIEREVSSSTLTRGSPSKPKQPFRRAARSALHRPCSRAPRHAGGLVLRGGHADVRVQAAGRRGDQVHRHRRACCPGRPRAALRRGLSPHRPAPGSAAPGWSRWSRRRCRASAPVADGRPQKYFGSLKFWPISDEPTALPSLTIRLPAACVGNATWATPVTSQRVDDAGDHASAATNRTHGGTNRVSS